MLERAGGSSRAQEGPEKPWHCTVQESLMTEERLLLPEENQLCQVSEAKSARKEEGLVCCVENRRG